MRQVQRKHQEPWKRHPVEEWYRSLLEAAQQNMGLLLEHGTDFRCKPISLQQAVWRWARKYEPNPPFAAFIEGKNVRLQLVNKDGSKVEAGAKIPSSVEQKAASTF